MKKNLLSFILSGSIFLVLLARFHVGLVRFFDPDEFAHLHWAWLVAQGNLPYRNFFFYATPLYQWFLFPLFKLQPGDRVLLLARLWEFLLYLLSTFFLFRIAKKITKNKTTSLLCILIFITFPMTFDKTIDIRPDILMTLLYFLAIDRILTWPILTAKRVLTIGLLLGASFMVFFKIIYALPAIAILIFFQKKITLKILALLKIGFLIPLGLFTLYLFLNNIQLLAWEAFSHIQFVVNTGKVTFSPLAALSPWPLVYVGMGGISFPWLVNMGIWITTLIGMVALLKMHKPFTIFSLGFFVCAILFLFLFPAPYVQYFIPLSVMASILAAVGIEHVIFKISYEINKARELSFILYYGFQISIFLVLLTSFFLQYRQRIAPASNNEEQLQVIRDVLAISKPTDTFYDMVGSYVFRPDGYFICCHPYGEFADKLITKPPTLRESLVANKTKYIILDRTGQSLWKPKKEDLDFLTTHYKPSQYYKIYIRQSGN